VSKVAQVQSGGAADRGFLGHPAGVGYIVFTEAWERFSFYGMQGLLVLYMAGYLFRPEAAAKPFIAGHGFHCPPPACCTDDCAGRLTDRRNEGIRKVSGVRTSPRRRRPC